MLLGLVVVSATVIIIIRILLKTLAFKVVMAMGTGGLKRRMNRTNLSSSNEQIAVAPLQLWQHQHLYFAPSHPSWF